MEYSHWGLVCRDSVTMYLNKVWRVGAWWVHKALNQEDPWFETKEKFQWKKSPNFLPGMVT